MENGKRFWGYLRNHIKWYLLIMLNGLLMAVMMLLNGIVYEEVCYGFLLCVVVLIVVAAADYYVYDKTCRKLSVLRHSVTLSLQGLPETTDPAEQIYQELLQILSRNRMWLENEARERERDRTEYYTMWVHQIKTPIASMRLHLDGEDSGRSRRLRSELLRIEQYVEMVLTYFRIGSDSSDYVFRTVSLGKVLRESVRKFRGDFIMKKLRLEYAASDITVISDEKWLSFVVEQILSNALKYTNEGAVTISLEEPGTLCISDTGIGIAPEDLPRIFEKGYTGGNGHENKRSSGLGLYLCRQICDRLGLAISIESEVESGTTVRLDLDQRRMTWK